MKILSVLLLVVALSGCFEISGYYSAQSNQETVMTQRQNLNGMTYQQIKGMFGTPIEVSTMQTQSGVAETWTYKHTSMNMLYNGATMMAVIFNNGVVIAVNYF